MRDQLVGVVAREAEPAQRVTVAVETGLETLILENAESAAERAEVAWRA